MSEYQMEPEALWLLDLVRNQIQGPTRIPQSLRYAAISHLISSGADPHWSRSCTTAFVEAIKCDDREVVRLFLDSNVSPNPPLKHWIEAPLITALKLGKVELSRMLVKSGATISQPQVDYCLSEFCRGGYRPDDAVDYLINQMKADSNALYLDKFGATPLLIACRRGDDRLAMCLLEHGADPDFHPQGHWSPATYVQKNSTYMPLSLAFYKRRALSQIMVSTKKRNRIVETPVVATRPLM